MVSKFHVFAVFRTIYKFNLRVFAANGEYSQRVTCIYVNHCVFTLTRTRVLAANTLREHSRHSP